MKHPNNKLTFFNMVMLMLVFIVIVITVQNVGILEAFASWEETRETVSEGGDSGVLVFGKLRVLLGLNAFHEKRDSLLSAPAPAPAPAPAKTTLDSRAPSPAPVSLHTRFHKHHRLPRPRPILPLHKLPVQHTDESKRKTVIMSVFLSTGLVLVIFVLAVFFLKRRFNRQKRVATRTTSLCSDEGGGRDRSNKGVTFVSKVSHDTSVDTFFLSSLSTALEPEVGNNVQGGLGEEIISDHEYSESSKNDSDDQSVSNTDNKGVDVEPHSSEDESFHSFGDSRSSSNRRLSNVSLGSVSDPVEISSPNNQIPKQIDSISDATVPTSSSPPPPPPPPPQPLVASNSLRFPTSTLKVQGSTSTGPPPPPPPYPNNKGKSSLIGPPTPPDQPHRFTPMGKDGNPLPKLKPLHWDKVRATPDRSMVWDQLRCSSFELDEETIESLFGYSLKTAFTNDDGKSKTPSPGKHVLEPKRLQNITILSKALNVTAEKVCEALIQGDGLCTQQLEALVKMEPTKEEETKLSDYKGDIDELGSAEKLVKELLKIPYAFIRVEAMLYKATFDDDVVHLKNSFSMLEEACKELRSNRLFLKLLEAVLKTGNRMNIGTIRGGAKAFKLEALLKLADVKGTDGKTTLLHFVVQEIVRAEGIRMSDSIMGQIDRTNKNGSIEEKEDDYKRMGLELVSGLSNELHNVKRTASLDLDVLATSVSNLSDEMLKLEKLVNKDLFASEDNFVTVMKKFLSQVEYKLKELQTKENMVLVSVREITEYYHGDVSKEEVNPLRIFVVVRDFLGMLDQVCRELKTLKTPRSPNPLAPFR